MACNRIIILAHNLLFILSFFCIYQAFHYVLFGIDIYLFIYLGRAERIFLRTNPINKFKKFYSNNDHSNIRSYTDFYYFISGSETDPRGTYPFVNILWYATNICPRINRVQQTTHLDYNPQHSLFLAFRDVSISS